MRQTIAFIDGAYFWEQAASFLASPAEPRLSRRQIDIDLAKLFSRLRAFSASFGADRFLRIYWFDAAHPSNRSSGLPYELEKIEQAPGYRLIQGRVNQRNSQKRVDGLILRHMLRLAHNRAMTDLILLSGDEDLIPAIEEAQDLGVRCAHLGIGFAQGAEELPSNCSPFVISSCDESALIGKKELTELARLAPSDQERQELNAEEAREALPVDLLRELEKSAMSLSEKLIREAGEKGAGSLFESIQKYNGMLPQDLDKKLLSHALSTLGRRLADNEKIALRHIFMLIFENDLRTGIQKNA